MPLDLGDGVSSRMTCLRLCSFPVLVVVVVVVDDCVFVAMVAMNAFLLNYYNAFRCWMGQSTVRLLKHSLL